MAMKLCGLSIEGKRKTMLFYKNMINIWDNHPVLTWYVIYPLYKAASGAPVSYNSASQTRTGAGVPVVVQIAYESKQ